MTDILSRLERLSRRDELVRRVQDRAQAAAAAAAQPQVAQPQAPEPPTGTAQPAAPLSAEPPPTDPGAAELGPGGLPAPRVPSAPGSPPSGSHPPGPRPQVPVAVPAHSPVPVQVPAPRAAPAPAARSHDDFDEVIAAVVHVVRQHPGLSVLLAPGDGRSGSAVVRISERLGEAEVSLVHATPRAQADPPAGLAAG